MAYNATWTAVLVLTTVVVVFSTAAYALRMWAAVRHRQSWYEEGEFFVFVLRPYSSVLYPLSFGLLFRGLSLGLC